MTYKIVRFYLKGRPRTLRTGLTLVEARTYLQNPETSSKTATGSAARKRTVRHGAWFDGYTKE